MRHALVLFIFHLICVLPTHLFAADVNFGNYISKNGSVRSRLTSGYLRAQANEYVYYNDIKLSQLIWDIKSAYTMELRGELDLTDRWMIYGSGAMAVHNRGYMVDYDYKFFNSIWTDRSKSPDTNLDLYYALDLGSRYKYRQTELTEMTVGLGFRYVDFQMSDYGGSFVYTTCQDGDEIKDCFRTFKGSYNDYSRGITYRQSLPVGFLELGVSKKVGIMKLEFLTLAGLSLQARENDMHWQRNTLFKGQYDSGPYGAIQANIRTDISKNVELFASARLEKFFKQRGDSYNYSFEDGSSWADKNGSALSFRSLSLGIGFRVGF